MKEVVLLAQNLAHQAVLDGGQAEADGAREAIHP